ncbi:hypothetical protein GOV14_05065 [Candidatus Pacearchaeota archaeon]|nr:hypothetical protein [Candidatus Pacearchaeota archaeon]
MIFHNFHPDKINLINMIPFGRASSVFMQGLFDGHPEIVTIIFYYLREKDVKGKNFEDLVDLNYNRMKERVDMYIGNYDLEKKFPKKEFRKYFKEYIDEFGISAKTVFIGVHYAYARHFKKDLKKVKYIFAHSHWPDVFLEMVGHFPKQKMLFLARDPRSSFLGGKKTESLVAAVMILRSTLNLYKKLKKKRKMDMLVIRHETLHTDYEKIKQVLVDWLKISKDKTINSATFFGLPFYGMNKQRVTSITGVLSDVPNPVFAKPKWEDKMSTAEINFTQFMFSDMFTMFDYKKRKMFEPLWVEYFATRRNLSLSMINGHYKGLRSFGLRGLRILYMVPLIGRPLVKLFWILKEVLHLAHDDLKIRSKIKSL